MIKLCSPLTHPACCIAWVTFPIASSTMSTMAAYCRLFTSLMKWYLSTYSSGASVGPCTHWNGRYRNKGEEALGIRMTFSACYREKKKVKCYAINTVYVSKITRYYIILHYLLTGQLITFTKNVSTTRHQAIVQEVTIRPTGHSKLLLVLNVSWNRDHLNELILSRTFWYRLYWQHTVVMLGSFSLYHNRMTRWLTNY